MGTSSSSTSLTVLMQGLLVPPMALHSTAQGLCCSHQGWGLGLIASKHAEERLNAASAVHQVLTQLVPLDQSA